MSSGSVGSWARDRAEIGDDRSLAGCRRLPSYLLQIWPVQIWPPQISPSLAPNRMTSGALPHDAGQHISAPTPTPGPLELTVCPIFFVKRSLPVFSRIMCIVHVRDPPSAGSSELQKAACHLHAGSRDIFPSTFIQVIIGYRCKKRWVNLDISIRCACSLR